MLPLWRDQLRIGISPDAVVLIRIGKGLRPRIREKHIEKCQPEPQETWQAALNTLTQLLAHKKWQDANATLTLSSHFVRYLLIPWHAEINGEQEQAAYVKHRFNKVFGACANHWTIRHSTASANTPRLASGIDQALLEGIRQACQEGKLQLQSVQPYLMQSFNRHRHLFTPSVNWFVLAEYGKLIIAQFHNQTWQHISTHLFDNALLSDALPVLLERQSTLSGIPNQPGKVWLYAPEHPKLSLPRNSKWVVQQLQPTSHIGLSFQESSQYALVTGDN